MGTKFKPSQRWKDKKQDKGQDQDQTEIDGFGIIANDTHEQEEEDEDNQQEKITEENGKQFFTFSYTCNSHMCFTRI